MSQKKCNKCGTLCSSAAKFCIRCRNPLNERPDQKRTCARGHRIDPTWTDCPFCESSKQTHASPFQTVSASVSRIRTMVETTAHVSQKPDPFATCLSEEVAATAPAVPPRTTQSQAPIPAARTSPPQAATGQAPKALPRDSTQIIHQQPLTRSGGLIVGVLVSFTNNPNGQAFLIRWGRNVLGTNESSTIRTNDSSVSEKHAIIAASEKGIFIDDCLSTNGTQVNGAALEEKTSLQHGDVIRTGNTLWRFARIDQPEQERSGEK